MRAQRSDAPGSGEELTCFGCGYDLRGLPPGTACPECGLVPVRALKAHGSLDHAPPPVVLGVSWRLVSCAVLLVVILPVATTSLMLFGWTLVLPSLLALILPFVSWLGTATWQEPSAVHHRLGAGDRLCLVARWSGLVWFAYLGVLLALPHAPNFQVPMLLLERLLWLAGLVQVLLLGIVTGRYAAWMRDEGAEVLLQFINASLVLISVLVLAGTVIDLSYGRLDLGGSGLIGVVARMLAGITLACGVILSAKLGLGALWSILHRHDNTAWDRIRAEREREEGAVFAERIDRMDEAGPGSAP